MITAVRRKLINLYYSKIKHMDGSDINIMNLRKRGIAIGEGCRIFTPINSREPTLITIGNNVTISSDVEFCTHDNGIIKAIAGKTDVVGPIRIGDDCFIGMRSILMYGVTLGDHCIVAAGAVVTKSFPARSVVGGNPARALCTIDDYAAKYEDYAIDFRSLPFENREEFFNNHPEKMVKR